VKRGFLYEHRKQARLLNPSISLFSSQADSSSEKNFVFTKLELNSDVIFKKDRIYL